jgi:hypothetical protein
MTNFVLFRGQADTPHDPVGKQARISYLAATQMYRRVSGEQTTTMTAR